MTRVAAVETAFPPHRYAQHEITATFAGLVGASPGRERALLERVHASAGVEHRHLALPLDAYAQLACFGAANDAFIRAAVELGTSAVEKALAAAGLAPSDVDLVIGATVTGLAVPSLDARVALATGMRPDVRRMPLVGLGCVAGAAGLARAHDHLVGHPDDVVVLLAVELCSLTVQRDDRSPANLVASALFGDAAAAVVLVGDRRAVDLGAGGPRVLGSRSRLYPGTERAMGWDVGASGLRVVLDAGVPDLVRRELGADVTAFLASSGLGLADVASWICHPGGPKVMAAVEDALGLDRDPAALAVTRTSLAEVGNCSSVSVLDVLQRTWTQRPGRPGDPAVLLAMGPGFCAELVLLRW